MSLHDWKDRASFTPTNTLRCTRATELVLTFHSPLVTYRRNWVSGSPFTTHDVSPPGVPFHHCARQMGTSFLQGPRILEHISLTISLRSRSAHRRLW